MQHSYKTSLNTKIAKFLQQQQVLLQNLAQELVQSLKRSDIANISTALRIFEDQMFVLSKLHLTTPISVSFVSLNAPQQFITSSGISDSSILAPDEDYYLATVSSPHTLQWSAPYIQEIMPQHQLVNFGIGAMLGEQYLGQLDAHMAMSSFEAYLHLDPQLVRLFDFNLSKGLSNPEIKIRHHAYLEAVILPAILQTLIITLLVALIYYAIQLHLRLKTYQNAANADKIQINNWKNSTNMYANILQIQYKYGEVLATAPLKETINMQELLNDAWAVNADLIKARNINITCTQDAKYFIQANRFRMMQILSGILYETLTQLPNDSNVSLQLEVQNIGLEQIQIQFRFSDNGFYKDLLERVEINSRTDVRAKGWGQIKQLIAAEFGKLEYIHTAYAGNTIVLTFTQPIFNNVINLSFQ